MIKLVGDLEPGEVYEWCGRRVRLIHREINRYNKNHVSYRLVTDVGVGDIHELHYSSTEAVRVYPEPWVTLE